MALQPRWVRLVNGFGSLTTTTTFTTLTPQNVPDQSTVTRIVGVVHFDFAPDAQVTSSPAALIVAGIGNFSVPEAIDVAAPNDFPDAFMWWDYQVVRANVVATSGSGLAPRSISVRFDVHGQRRIVRPANALLRMYARIVTPLSGTQQPVASIRWGISTLYLLPATA